MLAERSNWLGSVSGPRTDDGHSQKNAKSIGTFGKFYHLVPPVATVLMLIIITIMFMLAIELAV